MHFDQSLPVTLRERMNEDREIFIFQSWFREYCERTMSSSIATLSIYDKRTSHFVPRLEDP